METRPIERAVLVGDEIAQSGRGDGIADGGHLRGEEGPGAEACAV